MELPNFLPLADLDKNPIGSISFSPKSGNCVFRQVTTSAVIPDSPSNDWLKKCRAFGEFKFWIVPGSVPVLIEIEGDDQGKMTCVLGEDLTGHVSLGEEGKMIAVITRN